jgi:hypothetical protein
MDEDRSIEVKGKCVCKLMLSVSFEIVPGKNRINRGSLVLNSVVLTNVLTCNEFASRLYPYSLEDNKMLVSLVL